MKFISLLLTVALQPSVAARSEPPPSPPVAVHHLAPESRSTVTTIQCLDGNRTVALAFERSGAFRLISATRRSTALSNGAIESANEALRRLTHVSEVFGMCGPGNDLIYFAGWIGSRRVSLEMIWTDEELRPSPRAVIDL